MSSTITNNHNSLVTNLRNQLLKSFSTLPPPPTSIYRVSLPIDDMTLALLLPPHPTKQNQERVILSPVESHNNSSFLSNKSEEGCDNAHEDLLSRLIDAVEKKYSIQEDSCPENFKERLSKDWDNAQTKKQNLVMGMGENDGGVWFAPYPNKVMSSVEPLLQWELIRDTIALVRARRHGVGFGLYTSGILPHELSEIAADLKTNLGIKHCVVSLGCSNPTAYEKHLYHPSCGFDSPQKAFQSACSFIATAAESGFPVEAAVIEGSDSVAASQLARALGAVNVRIYPLPKSS